MVWLWIALAAVLAAALLLLLAGGGTDAGAIAQSRGGVPSGVLSIPCRYVHSAAETVDLSDMEAGVKTLVEYLSH